MARILVVEFWPLCHLGAIAPTFAARGADSDIVRTEKGDVLPGSDEPWDGLVMLGGTQYAEDDAGYPCLAAGAALARRFHDAAKPVLGVCLGGQLLARGLGARVRRQGWTEVGFVELAPTPEAADDPLLSGIGPVRPMLYHEDSFDIPPGATMLLAGSRCANQAFRLGASYGFQCHFECDRALWEEWFPALSDDLLAVDPDFHAGWRREFERHGAAAAAFCEKVSGRWLDLVEARPRQAT